MSGNRLDANNLWKLFDSVESNSSITELRADQQEEAPSPKLIYKLCEMLLNNRSLQRLYYGASVPFTIVLSELLCETR